MQYLEFFLYGLGGMLIFLIYNYINATSNEEQQANEDGKYVLRMNRLYQIIGIISLVVAAVFTIGVIIYFDIEMLILGVMMLLLFGGLGSLCFLYYKNHIVSFDEEAIEITDWRGRENRLYWDEIHKISFNRFSGLVKLESVGKQAGLHYHLVGLVDFVTMMENKTQWRAKALKLPIEK